MIPLQYFAGFGPKDFMLLLYGPAFGILLLASIIIYIIKRRGHPYTLAVLIFPLVALGWYLYDKLAIKKVDRSQAIILAGVVVVLGVYAIASSSFIPEKDSAVNGMALLATIISLCFLLVSIVQRNK